MTDDARSALEWLRDVATLHRKEWLRETARAILAHIADLEARAEKAEAREAELRATLERLNAELDAFWNEPAEIKYPEGRMNVVYERLITDAQMACREALAAAPAAPSEPVYKAVERILDEESAWVARPSPEVTRRIALAVTIAAFQAHGVEAANAVRVDELEALLREARDELRLGVLDLKARIDAALARQMGGGDAE